MANKLLADVLSAEPPVGCEGIVDVLTRIGWNVVVVPQTGVIQATRGEWTYRTQGSALDVVARRVAVWVGQMEAKQ